MQKNAILYISLNHLMNFIWWVFMKFDLIKFGVMKCISDGTIVQNLNFKTFYYKNDQNGIKILFSFLKTKIHLITTL